MPHFLNSELEYTFFSSLAIGIPFTSSRRDGILQMGLTLQPRKHVHLIGKKVPSKIKTF
jgi:hypothetical protein